MDPPLASTGNVPVSWVPGLARINSSRYHCPGSARRGATAEEWPLLGVTQVFLLDQAKWRYKGSLHIQDGSFSRHFPSRRARGSLWIFILPPPDASRNLDCPSAPDVGGRNAQGEAGSLTRWCLPQMGAPCVCPSLDLWSHVQIQIASPEVEPSMNPAAIPGGPSRWRWRP